MGCASGTAAITARGWVEGHCESSFHVGQITYDGNIPYESPLINCSWGHVPAASAIISLSVGGSSVQSAALHGL
jgi:hypothetical protein